LHNALLRNKQSLIVKIHRMPQITLNGFDYTEDGVTFQYVGVPFLGSWSLAELLVLIGGCVLVAALLIVTIAIIVYRKARANDLSRR
jgi:hypothetical protein